MSGFGSFLIERGLIESEELQQALKLQLSELKPLGRLAVEEGCLSPQQVSKLRSIQHHDERLIGDLAVDRAWIQREELDKLLDLQQSRKRRLGEILVGMDLLSIEKMQEALDEFEAVARLRRQAAAALLDEMPRGQVLEKLIDYAGRHLERATGEPFTLAFLDFDPRCRRLFSSREYDAVFQELTGDGSVAFALLLDNDWKEFIVSGMMEFQRAAEGEMIEDAIKELVNLIVGNALSALGADAVGLHSTPPGICRPADLSFGSGGCVFLEFYGPRGIVMGLVLLGDRKAENPSRQEESLDGSG